MAPVTFHPLNVAGIESGSSGRSDKSKQKRKLFYITKTMERNSEKKDIKTQRAIYLKTKNPKP